VFSHLHRARGQKQSTIKTKIAPIDAPVLEPSKNVVMVGLLRRKVKMYEKKNWKRKTRQKTTVNQLPKTSARDDNACVGHTFSEPPLSVPRYLSSGRPRRAITGRSIRL